MAGRPIVFEEIGASEWLEGEKGEVEMPYSLRDTREFVEAALIHQDAATAFKQTYYGYIQEDSEKKALKDM